MIGALRMPESIVRFWNGITENNVMPRPRMKAYTKKRRFLFQIEECDECKVAFSLKQRSERHHRYCQECYDLFFRKGVLIRA